MASASSPDTLAVSPLNAPPSKTKLMPSSEAEYEPTRDPDRQEQIYLLTEQDDEEAASHRIIEDYVREEGLYAASRDFRVDLYDFVRDESNDMVHVATETSRTDRDHDDESMSSDAPSSAASSVRFIVATPMPDVPSAWKAAFAFQMTSTPSVKSHIAAQVPCTAAATNVGDTRPGHRTSPEQKALASPRLPAIMVIRTPESSEASSSSVPSTAESSFSSQVEAIASKCLPYSKTTHLAKTAHLKQIGGPRLATLSPVPGTGGKQAILIVAPPPPPPRSEAPSSPSPSTRSQASPKSRVSLLANESIDSSGPISASSTFSLSVQQPTSREKDPSEPVHQSLESERNQAPLAAEPQSGTSVKATRQPGTAPLGGADSTKRSFRLPSLYPATAADSRPLHKTVVLRLTNVPWTVTVTELTKWMGLEFSKAVLPSTVQIVSVHICCDRFKGRTRAPVFVELSSAKVAYAAASEKNGKMMRDREIKVSAGTRRELMAMIFPTWAAANFSSAEGTPILSDNEIEGLKELCKLKAPFIKQTPERAYYNILSIAAKFPWRSKDALSPQSDQQNKALQLVRDGFRLLNQYGKRVESYPALRNLFMQFLESHGGIAGSLRVVPVNPTLCGLKNKEEQKDESTCGETHSNRSAYGTKGAKLPRPVAVEPAKQVNQVGDKPEPTDASAPPSSLVESIAARPRQSGVVPTNTPSEDEKSLKNFAAEQSQPMDIDNIVDKAVVNAANLAELLKRCVSENDGPSTTKSITGLDAGHLATAAEALDPGKEKSAQHTLKPAGQYSPSSAQQQGEAMQVDQVTPEQDAQKSLRAVHALNAEFDRRAAKELKQNKKRSLRRHVHGDGAENEEGRQDEPAILPKQPVFTEGKTNKKIPAASTDRDGTFLVTKSSDELTAAGKRTFTAFEVSGRAPASEPRSAAGAREKDKPSPPPQSQGSSMIVEKADVLEKLFTPERPAKSAGDPATGRSKEGDYTRKRQRRVPAGKPRPAKSLRGRSLAKPSGQKQVSDQGESRYQSATRKEVSQLDQLAVDLGLEREVIKNVIERIGNLLKE